MTEHRLQQECFLWHWNTHPAERGCLWHVNNNARNRIQGAVLKAIGVVKGVSDLHYLRPDGVTIYIEVKLPGERQSPAQQQWQKLVEDRGGEYHIITTLEEFQNLIHHAQTQKAA